MPLARYICAICSAGVSRLLSSCRDAEPSPSASNPREVGLALSDKVTPSINHYSNFHNQHRSVLILSFPDSIKHYRTFLLSVNLVVEPCSNHGSGKKITLRTLMVFPVYLQANSRIEPHIRPGQSLPHIDYCTIILSFDTIQLELAASLNVCMYKEWAIKIQPLHRGIQWSMKRR
jgi:hypothetical protein